MKKILFVLCLGVIVGCSEKEENSKDKLREEVIERHEGGEKKLVVTYKGEANSEEIICKRFYCTDGSLCSMIEFQDDKRIESDYSGHPVYDLKDEEIIGMRNLKDFLYLKEIYMQNRKIYRYYVDFWSGDVEEENYNEWGEKDGVCRYFNIEGFMEYHSGGFEADGDGQTFYPKDPLEFNLYREDNYVNGLLNGMRREFHKNGQLIYEGNFVNDKKDGIHREWNSDGSLKSEKEYIDGVLKGSEKDGKKAKASTSFMA